MKNKSNEIKTIHELVAILEKRHASVVPFEGFKGYVFKLVNRFGATKASHLITRGF